MKVILLEIGNLRQIFTSLMNSPSVKLDV